MLGRSENSSTRWLARIARAFPRSYPVITMATKRRIVRIGSSRRIRIPKSLLDEADLPEEVELHAQPGRLVVRASSPDHIDQVRSRGMEVAIAGWPGYPSRPRHLVRLDATCGVVSPDELNYYLRTAKVAPMTTGGRAYSRRPRCRFQSRGMWIRFRASSGARRWSTTRRQRPRSHCRWTTLEGST
jgi:antitoxin component of MazEF toxin-antitoxin module